MKMIRLYAKCLTAVVSFAVAAMTVRAAPILLKSGKIDPGVIGTKRQVMPTTSSSDASAVTTTKWIIQHDGIITDGWRAKLEASGAKILRYIPENAYLISATSEILATIRGSITYSALLPYAKVYRIDPKVKAEQNAVLETTMTTAHSEANSDLTVSGSRYVISLFSKNIRDVYVGQIDNLPGCRVFQADGSVIEAVLTPTGLEIVAALDEVSYISPWHETLLHNNVAVQSPRMNIETVWPDGDSDLGLTGEGQVVAVADTGLDTGDLSTLHEDVRGRVLNAYPLSSWVRKIYEVI